MYQLIQNFYLLIETCFYLKKNLSSRLLQEVIAVIIVFDKVTSKNIKKTGKKELKNLFSKRMIKRKDYFSNNDLIKNTYRFIFEVVKVFC